MECIGAVGISELLRISCCAAAMAEPTTCRARMLQHRPMDHGKQHMICILSVQSQQNPRRGENRAQNCTRRLAKPGAFVEQQQRLAARDPEEFADTHGPDALQGLARHLLPRSLSCHTTRNPTSTSHKSQQLLATRSMGTYGRPGQCYGTTPGTREADLETTHQTSFELLP